MKKVIIALFVVMSFTGAAFAQATRTWVSGVGDDANPCSRTAPCKTFAGAISKTASGGEIDVLDPGGFGGVTITKSMRIDASAIAGGVLVSGTNGVVVNGAGAQVVLRNLVINGLGSGTNGVNIINASKVLLDGCNVNGFATTGVLVNASAAMQVTISNSVISNNPGTGVSVAPTVGSPVVNITIDHCLIVQNGSRGILFSSGAVGTVSHSTISQNVSDGILVQQPAGVTSANILDCIFTNNNNGINASSGSTRLSGDEIFNNASGVAGTVLTAGNNHVFGNGLNNTIVSGGGIGGNQ
jgi:hypothetical protein